MTTTDETPWVLLDGKMVPPTEIDPSKHKFIGAFRPPVDPAAGANTYVYCRCGYIQKYVHEAREHYARGCWDIPQYVSLQYWKPSDKTAA